MRLVERTLPANYSPGALAALNVPLTLERVYAARGVCSVAELDSALAHLLPPTGLSGLNAAVALLVQALAQDWVIVIVGDFDADGATGTAVAVRGLRLLGAKHVRYRVPNRFTHGYGLSPALVETLIEDAARTPETQPLPSLLMTVDNGTSSIAGVARANAAGMQVLVTDHHLPGTELPAAAAIVNPNVGNEAFASKNLCGAGVVFYLLLSLRAKLRELGRYQGGVEPNLSALIDLVALATVADLVPLDRNNRILVEQGLRRLRAGAGTMGLRALLATSGTDTASVSAQDFGFRLGPRINAAGRLEDMSIGIECLLTDDPARARQLAEQLGALNTERREIQAQMQHEAFAALDKLNISPTRNSPLPPVIIVADVEWHQGVVGLVASKLAERFHRPAIAFAPGELDGDGNVLHWRGSARSISGLHLRDALALLDARQPHLMQRFGGHAMAAGLSLENAQFAHFQKLAPKVFASVLAPELLHEIIYTDGELAPAEFNVALAQAIRFGGPWGMSFPEPSFTIDAQISDVQTLSGGHLRCKLRWGGAPALVSAVWFSPELSADALPRSAKLLVQITVDDFRGLASARLLIRRMLAQDDR
jgi:single-stranded-DNA-specific exonuclease